MMQRAFLRQLKHTTSRHIPGGTPLTSSLASLCPSGTVPSSSKSDSNYSPQASFFHSTAQRSDSLPSWHGTTILCVRKNGQVCMIGDGQVSMGNMVVKPNARKIRKIHPKTIGGKPIKSSGNDDDKEKEGEKANNGGTIVGFAGSTADAFTLLERLESKLDEYPNQLARSSVELAKGWRTDKYLRRLEASLLVADQHVSLEITGNGDVLESHDKVLAVGSGSPFAIAAARALQDVDELSAEDVARKAMEIASDMCVFTNKNFLVEVMDIVEEDKDEKKKDE